MARESSEDTCARGERSVSMICINHVVMLQAGPGNLDLDGSETMSTDSQVSGCATGDTSSSLFT